MFYFSNKENISRILLVLKYTNYKLDT